MCMHGEYCPHRTGWIATDKTSGSNLFGREVRLQMAINTPIEITLTARNVLDRKYFQSPEFLPQVGDSRTGQNLQVLIKFHLNKYSNENKINFFSAICNTN